MYIIRPTRKTATKTYQSALLIESYREDGKVKHRTLANLAKWQEPLVIEFEKLLKGGKVTQIEDLHHTQGNSCGGLLVIQQLCNRLGITQALGRSKQATLALLMIMGRILTPGTSRLGLVEWAKDQAVEEVLGVSGFTEDDLYATLEWLAERQQQIEAKLFHFRYSGEKTSEVYLYDVTSSYLEGLQNELASFGYSRDKKRGKKQIVAGLLCDHTGYPISVEVFQGNTQDPKTVSSQLGKLKHNFGVERVVFVGDRGMLKSEQIKEVTSKEFKWNYITAITKPQIEKMLKDGKFEMDLFDEQVAEIEDFKTKLRYILRRNPIRAQEMRKTRREKIARIEQKVEEKNKYLEEHKRASITVALRDINNLVVRLKLKDIVISDGQQRTINYTIDQDALAEVAKLDGCYVIKTDVPKNCADKEIIHGRYKDLTKVEIAFRTFKTGFEEMRPIFVRKEQRTRAHVFICMLAYMILYEIWNRVGDLQWTRDFVINTLEKIQFSTYDFQGMEIKRLPAKLLDHQQQILDQLQIELPSRL